MGRKSIIQNEELLFEVLDSGEEFFIPCRDRLDAHSKSVSLNNARSRLMESQQKVIRVQKTKIGEVWGVKIFPADKITVFKLVGEEMIPWSGSSSKISEEVDRVIKLMVKDGRSDEEIVAMFSDEDVNLVKSTIEFFRSN